MTATREPNAQYNLAAPDSLPARIATRARRRMYERFLRETAIRPEETLLDVGATSDDSYESSNYVEAWYPHKQRITAVGIDDGAAFLEQRYPGVAFKRADGLDLPFGDGQFDVVHSSAVLEHVGAAQNQRRFVAELTRVARRAVFITTPNRWFPVEFHTQLPLAHWLPKPLFRRLLAPTRYQFFAREENLNLLGARELRGLVRGAPGCVARVDSIRLLGWPSNLLLIVAKAG
jgi:ubiquinone/menaquinone biosynthesis C-methylase UbiE